jgi:hypothetical protein
MKISRGVTRSNLSDHAPDGGYGGQVFAPTLPGDFFDW